MFESKRQDCVIIKTTSIMIPSYQFQNMIGNITSHFLSMKATIVLTTFLILTLVYCIIQHTCWSWWCVYPTLRNTTRLNSNHHLPTTSFQSSTDDVSSVQLNDLPSTQQVV